MTSGARYSGVPHKVQVSGGGGGGGASPLDVAGEDGV